jgi:hypothetical protein
MPAHPDGDSFVIARSVSDEAIQGLQAPPPPASGLRLKANA